MDAYFLSTDAGSVVVKAGNNVVVLRFNSSGTPWFRGDCDVGFPTGIVYGCKCKPSKRKDYIPIFVNAQFSNDIRAYTAVPWHAQAKIFHRRWTRLSRGEMIILPLKTAKSLPQVPKLGCGRLFAVRNYIEKCLKPLQRLFTLFNEAPKTVESQKVSPLISANTQNVCKIFQI